MMSKTGKSGFTARKVVPSLENWGKTMQTTKAHLKRLVEDLQARDPSVTKKLEIINSQY